MRTEGDFIRIHRWLIPLSWLYGLGVWIRNMLFEWGVFKSKSFDIPIISVGNITVGGSGKTPHVEYLVRLLKDLTQVAVLSRGYKRKTKGYLVADEKTSVSDIGDEPYQMKKKFGNVHIVVDKDRCHGITRIQTDEATKNTGVVLLDDAYQHRYVKPGINILLVDYHRLIIYDKLLPAGCLRESKEGKNRADIVIITKCPKDLKPMEFRVLTKAMELYPFQQLYFTTIDYDKLRDFDGDGSYPLNSIHKNTHVLLITGIASPKQMIEDLKHYTSHITHLAFPDHHQFTKSDVNKINDTYRKQKQPCMVITTEKDATRLYELTTLDADVVKNMKVLPIRVKFMLNQSSEFNNKIIDYVRKNSRNSILAQRKDDNTATDGNHPGNRTRTISF